MRISYNAWEKLFLFDLYVISAIHTLIATGGLSKKTVEYIAVFLYVLPTVTILLACLSHQCFHKKGGYSRLRHLSVAWWWRQRRARTQPDGGDELRESVLQDMLSGMRDPLMVEQLRQR